MGISIHVEHRAASGIGVRVHAEAELESFDGRFYIMRVRAHDGSQEIGRGTVGRAVVHVPSFVKRMREKARGELTGREANDKRAMESHTNKAIQFRQLHRGPGVLILPNAWDVASARIFEEAGFPAIATTSAGIAFSLGYPDGQRIPREEMLARIGRIARAVHVPVTADIESGYGSTPEDAAQTTRELIQAGVVGMNLEDGSGRRDRL